jgi:integrase/recombinase XerD
VRASELCNAKLSDLDIRNKQLTVTGKGNKRRVLEISNRTMQVIWRYLVTRAELPVGDPLFANNDDLFLTRSGLRRLVSRLGTRAGVEAAYPHRFRDTFGMRLIFLRNGGNIYALQALLGHSSLEMVKRYLILSEQDCSAVHRFASPVANWGL